jgi:hypothetical protein
MTRLFRYQLTWLAFGITWFVLPPSLYARSSGIDAALASQYFREAQSLSQRDQGKLWKIEIYGPMLFVDGETRSIAANQADPEGKLTQQGDVFIGTLPKDIGVANTAMEWAGVKWTMMIWPLPEDKQDRARLMMHESFHRIQDKLKLPMSNPANRHLDSQDGRIWLQMEWRALTIALMEREVSRRKAIEDALVFRRYRQSLFPGAAAEERALEFNEGLAEYTGVRLSTRSDAEAAALAVSGLRNARDRPSFVRSFAYVSGPAYGELLDESKISWRQQIRVEDDFGSLLERVMVLKLPPATRMEVMKRSTAYDGDALIAAETQREALHQQKLNQYRARFFENPVLILPVTNKFRFSFDPNNLMPLDESATVYPTLWVSDSWGVLDCSQGALLLRENGRVAEIRIPLPKDVDSLPLRGEGWTLELSVGWKMEPGPRKGDLRLSRVP